MYSQGQGRARDQETSAIKSLKKLRTKFLQSFHINYNLKWEKLQINMNKVNLFKKKMHCLQNLNLT